MPFPLPNDTANAFVIGHEECRNLGLLFQRYVEYRDGWVLDKDKLAVFKDIVERAAEAKRSTDRRSSDYRNLIQRHHERWQLTAKSAGAPDDCLFEASPDWRFVIGLGQDSALETGFTFHHLYGFPYIPGTALKGLTQTYALWLVAEHFGVPGMLPGKKVDGDTPVEMLEAILLTTEEKERRDLLNKLRHNRFLPDQSRLKALPEEDQALDQIVKAMDEHEAARNYRTIFGTQSGRGQAVFFDAVPVEPPKLTIDVMNPHYGPYYQEKGNKTPPADYLNPVPVYFLAVESGSRFAFAVAAADASLARLTCEWLKGALSTMGIGGKTSAGYGYFTVAVPALVAPTPSTAQSTNVPSARTSQDPLADETWRSGVVREYNSAGKRGRLVDETSGVELYFRSDAIQDKSWTPGKGHRVQYVSKRDGDKSDVVRLRRL